MIETAKGSLADAGETRRYESDPEYSYSAEEFSRRVRHVAPTRQTRPAAERAPRVSRAAARSRSGQSDPLIGQRVRHATYGVGTIIGVEGEDEDRKLTVSFSNHGTKKLVERYANLSVA